MFRTDSIFPRSTKLLDKLLKSGPPNHTMRPTHVYEIRPRSDKRGVDLISDALPFARLWYGEPDAIANAIGYAKFYNRSHDAVIRVRVGISPNCNASSTALTG